MEFCEICSIRHIVHKDIRFEWKKLVPATSRRFDIVQKLLDGKIIREEDYKGPNYDYDKDRDR